METNVVLSSGVEVIKDTEKKDFDFIKLIDIVERLTSQKVRYSSTLYHYTTIESLVEGIIPKDNDDKLTFWATHCDYMNDPQEMKADFERLDNDYSHITAIGNLYAALVDEKNEKGRKIDDIFLLSFSEKKDFLPMWSMYGKNGNGIVLEFEKFKLNNPNFITLKCLYPDSEEYKSLTKFFKAIFSAKP